MAKRRGGFQTRPYGMGQALLYGETLVGEGPPGVVRY